VGKPSARSDLGQSAIDHNLRPDDERRIIAGKKQRRFGDLGGLAETTQRNPRFDPCDRAVQLLPGKSELGMERGVDRAPD
jgi:hypothetical protein